MKLILSRKAFDSSAGGVASPILDDGSMIPMPIPDRTSGIRYGDIAVAGHDLGSIAADLTRGHVRANHFAHLDPDLNPASIDRPSGWRPLFGQVGAAQSVLSREGIGPGDLFLFFGWFRRASRASGRLAFVPGAPDLHVIWGWLQVEDVVSVGTSGCADWMSYHPHVSSPRGANNTVYVGRRSLSLAGETTRVSGAGTFGTYEERLRLTQPGAGRSTWALPRWFAPRERRPPLGYHGDPTRWRIEGEHVQLRSASRGQEFILDVEWYPEALGWIDELFAGRTHPRQPLAKEATTMRASD